MKLTLHSLIAVHGLGANPHQTWSWRPPSALSGNEEQTSKIEVNWLQTLLPSVLPKARIKTFNYMSDWRSDAPHESLRNISQKLLSNLHAESASELDGKQRAPLIFLGHSFGGLVIEKVSRKEILRHKLTNLKVGSCSSGSN